jgi:hypothetical protein
MPKEPTGDNILAKPTVKVNQAVLRGFAVLANDLGFESHEISQLKKLPISLSIENKMAWRTKKMEMWSSKQTDL